MMRPYLQVLAKNAPFAVSAHPNAGLPNEFGKYDETADMMEAMAGAEATDADGKKVDSKEKDKHAKDAYLKETQQIIADWLKGPLASVKPVAKK